MNEDSVEPQKKETNMTNKATRLAFTERTLQRWRMIQIISLLPLLVSVVLMLYFKGSMLGTIGIPPHSPGGDRKPSKGNIKIAFRRKWLEGSS